MKKLQLQFLLAWVLFGFFLPLPVEAALTLDNPYQIFRMHYDHIGGLKRLKAIKTQTSTGRIRYDGLLGTFRHWEESPLRHRTEEEYGVISQIDGDSGDEAWFYDTNGQLLRMRDPDLLKRRQIAVLLEKFEHLNSHSEYFSLTLGPEKSIGGTACYQVILKNSINSDILQFFFDSETFFLLRSIARRPDTEIITDYDDFRWTQDLLVPYHSLSRYLPWGTEEESWTDVLHFNVPIKFSRFTPPPLKKDYHFPIKTDSVTVNLKLIENQLFIPISIEKETRYWLLDSGASMSIIDEDYARGLGLTPEGRIAGHGFGENFSLGFVNLPEYQVGKLKLNPQKVYVSKGLSAKSYEPVIAGVAGYDLLSRFVVELDYTNGHVTFHDPTSFRYRGPGHIFDAPLKYRTFTLPVQLDDFEEGVWSLDLGAYRSSLHYPFSKKNGLTTRRGVASVSQGMSGIVHEKLSRFGRLRIGNFELSNQVIAIAEETRVGAASRGETDGNLGNSTLRNFHLFLDYPNQKVILEKSKEFNVVPRTDKSGLLIGRSKDNVPMVSFVAAHTPAAKAGVRAGDIILNLQGKEIGAEDKVMELRKILRGEPGTTIFLRVKRDKIRIDFQFELADLLPVLR